MARSGHSHFRVMEQEIRFCEVDGRRVAYTATGDGPPLVFAGRFATHLEEEWADPAMRSFFVELSQTRRVVRYDRIGSGLSERVLPPGSAVETEVRTLAAILDETVAGPAAVFSCSCGCVATTTLAAREPERFERIVWFGSFAR